MKKVSEMGEEYYEDENGWKQGRYIYREPDGLKVYESIYRDDQEHGEFKEYYGRPKDGVTRRGIHINDEIVEFLDPKKIYDEQDKTFLALKFGTFGWLASGG